jgi:hypothetical protein
MTMAAKNTNELIGAFWRVDETMKSAVADLNETTGGKVVALRDSMIRNGAREGVAEEAAADLGTAISRALEALADVRRHVDHAEQAVQAGVRRTRVQSSNPDGSHYLML